MYGTEAPVYTFEDLIDGGYLYVDKTEQLWQLMEPGKGIYFLSRPRRFGKSLTISTLKAAFQGKQKLFEGLALATKPFDWKPYPIIHLDLAERPACSAQELDLMLQRALDNCAKENGVGPLSEGNAPLRFSELIRAMAAKGKWSS